MQNKNQFVGVGMRVKFYGPKDMAAGFMLAGALEVLKRLSKDNKYESINDIVELFNIQKFIEAKFFLDSFTDEDKAYFSNNNLQLIKSLIGKYFSKFDGSLLLSFKGSIEHEYIRDIIELINVYKVYTRISGDIFVKFVTENHIPLSCILSYPNIVDEYDKELRELMLGDPRSVGILINKYNKSKQKAIIYLPQSLTLADKESIVIKYIESEYVHPDLLQIIENLRINPDFQISDETRLLAKERREREINKLFGNDSISCIKTEISAMISEDQEEPVVMFNSIDKISISVSGKWIKGNLDYATILNNFIYIYKLVDSELRISHISKINQMGVIERALIDSEIKDHYVKGSQFDLNNHYSLVAVVSYCEYLSNECNIKIENVLQWFFDNYLVEEFGVEQFIVQMPSSGSTFLEKCRTLCCEMESILKQYKVWVNYGKIMHDLLQMSPAPVEFSSIPSIMPEKYLYGNEENDEYQMASIGLFSDQTMLNYLPHRNINEKYKCLFDLIRHEDISMSDYKQFQQQSLQSLINLHVIKQDEFGNLKIANCYEAAILFDIYNNGFACSAFWKNLGFGTAIQNLKERGWIYSESSLLSKQESDYFDFYLNKAKFTNGYNLRNNYLHGTQQKQGTDSDLHKVNYYRLLILVVLIVIKINEEMSLKFPAKC